MSILKISAINYGWFELQICESYLECSDYLGYDTPKMLLKAFLKLFERKSCEEWLCWQNEPTACIMQLISQSDRLKIKVFASKAEAFKIGISEDSLKPNCKECLIDADFNFSAAVRSLVKEFARYEKGDGRIHYEKHWMDFPQEEYIALKTQTATVKSRR